jgi:hypothetical protein
MCLPPKEVRLFLFTAGKQNSKNFLSLCQFLTAPLSSTLPLPATQVNLN